MTDDRPEIVCLSIKRRYAEAIYRGEKRYEYRRQAPAVDPPYHLLLYETEPTGSVTGAALVDDEVHGPVEDVIDETVADTPHTKRELRDYFDGAEEGSALRIASTTRFQPRMDLVQVGIASAPQNFQYVEAGDLPATVADELRELVAGENTEATIA